MNEEVKENYLKLTTLLDSQVKVYRNLLDVVRKEKDILISADLDDLSENNKAKESMLIRARSLETQRIHVARELCLSLKIDSEAPRLLDIAVALQGAMGDKLRNLHSVLELLLKRVQEHNQQNEELVDSALKNITGAMKAIRDTLDENPTYKKEGEKSTQPAQSGQLVSREA